MYIRDKDQLHIVVKCLMSPKKLIETNAKKTNNYKQKIYIQIQQNDNRQLPVNSLVLWPSTFFNYNITIQYDKRKSMQNNDFHTFLTTQYGEYSL